MSYRKLENILTPTGVGAGTYGSNTTALVATVDAAGRLTGLSARPIALSPDSISNVSTVASANTLVRRDANGSFSANTITAALNGRASSALRLDKPFKLDLIGDVAGSFTTDGSADQTAMVYLASSGVTAGSYGFADTVPTLLVDAKGRVTAATNRPIQILSSAVTDATPNTTANSIVRRNTNGGFSAGPSNFGALTTFQLTVGPNGDLSGGINLVRGTANSALNGSTVRYDLDGNSLRWYENAVPYRGVFLDLTACGTQSSLLHTGIFDPTSPTANFAGTAAQVSDNITVGGTSHLGIPVGTTAQRPAGSTGRIRFNTTSGQYEAYVASPFPTWVSFAKAASRFYTASQFDNPSAGADWNVTGLAPAQADPANPALTVRAFDDTAVESVGFTVFVPANITTIAMRWRVRCASAPTGPTNSAIFAACFRAFVPNVAVPAWTNAPIAPSVFALTNQWHQFSAALPLTAVPQIVPGAMHQFQFIRVGNSPSDTIVGDIFLSDLIFDFY